MAWPDGIPEPEARLFGLLPAESQEIAIRRIDVLVDVELGYLPVGVGAERLGLSRPSFHDLRRKWRAVRSIASVVPYVGRAARKALFDREQARLVAEGDPRDRTVDPLATLALSIIEDPASRGLSDGELSLRLIADARAPLSRPKALQIVRRMQQAARHRPEDLARNYGRELVLDLSGLAALTQGRDGSIEPVIGSFLVEAASGLILGFSAGTRDEASEGQVAALERGLEFLHVRCADRPARPPASLTIVTAPVPDGGTDELARRLDRLGDGIDVVSRGRRRYGTRLLTVLGHRVGRLDLRPASTPHDAPVPKPSLSYLAEPIGTGTALGVLDDHVRDHNAPIERDLGSLGLIGAEGASEGSMSSTVHRALAAYRSR